MEFDTAKTLSSEKADSIQPSTLAVARNSHLTLIHDMWDCFLLKNNLAKLYRSRLRVPILLVRWEDVTDTDRGRAREMKRLLVLEDDSACQRLLTETFSPSFDISFQDGRSALKSARSKQYDAVIFDMASGSTGVMDLLKNFKTAMPNTPVIVTSRNENAELVVKTIKMGAYDFIAKPYTVARVQHLIKQALEERSKKNEIDYLRHEQDVVYDFSRIVAESPVMKRIVSTLGKFSKTDGTILITGETGTGKSFLSGSIHFNSPRREKPFVKVNCANIPETLLESELFGHEKGAFTGAEKMRIGRFEQAHGGTLFLDEIGEMGQALQSKMLRVLEDKAFERVGGNQTIHVDVRVIAATNRNLPQQVAEGEFREDLYYRINVLTLSLPPLRERLACLEPLARMLLSKSCTAMGKKSMSISPEALEVIKTGAWPGNIRQLANALERAVILEEGSMIQADSLVLPDAIPPKQKSADPSAPSAPSPRAMSLEEQEKEMIRETLASCLWIQKDAALRLGISPRALNYKIKKYGITHSRWRKHKAAEDLSE
jgi:DNA-binding NtrC family response regulator